MESQSIYSLLWIQLHLNKSHTLPTTTSKLTYHHTLSWPREAIKSGEIAQETDTKRDRRTGFLFSRSDPSGFDFPGMGFSALCIFFIFFSHSQHFHHSYPYRPLIDGFGLAPLLIFLSGNSWSPFTCLIIFEGALHRVSCYFDTTTRKPHLYPLPFSTGIYPFSMNMALISFVYILFPPLHIVWLFAVLSLLSY